MGSLRFERKSPAPQAGRIPSYPTSPDGITRRGADVVTLYIYYSNTLSVKNHPVLFFFLMEWRMSLILAKI